MQKWYVIIVLNLVIPRRIFKIFGYPKIGKTTKICSKFNETGHIAISCPKNNENSSLDWRESNADIDGLLLWAVIYGPCDK